MKNCFKMCYRRKMLLATVIFTALCYKLYFKFHTQLKVTAVKQLDMAPEAVDTLYDGCDEQALKMVIHSVLKQELNRSEVFQRAWDTKCSEIIPGGVKEHTAALLTHAHEDDGFREIFNNAVATMGGNVSTYENSFHFKSLHFLLMDAMKLMKPLNGEKCKSVFYAPETKYAAQKGSKVRFGRFTLVHSDGTAMEEPTEGDTFFNITTCFYVSLGGFCKQKGDEVLISPAEEFTVEDVVQKNDDGLQYTEIRLKHSKLASSHDCYIFSRSPADVSTQWLMLVLLGFSLFFFNC
ncbi:erythroblast NAD(P)(+)--arginine ADP-ribosyltransferase isoform X1 [Thunnus albacares]|uniref:erythroblast NAD(P)(+)--arginine ADP-ribosyltransferase isoform X1 n=1 Tax=Thunnus albacares TaxID=8236 RepID=UPI001CF644FD|nr:erythroblast NAD(P)(+)--arginine ADP-ribosyltransferase isoform X1 [Thunnus albacares]XP_044201423.1 erythroblast NAD(P)(+)--arginine ADP-ribosyltransferase isoform X1 [Thunnus albacares]XP_044201424.1 erythroblast NAD(P)(+)--arginine ADP-ribosyltransferase isoform X1 [Thunnus albacares]